MLRLSAAVMIAGCAVMLDSDSSFAEEEEQQQVDKTYTLVIPGVSSDGIMHPFARPNLPTTVILPEISHDGVPTPEPVEVEAAGVPEYFPKGKVPAQEPFNVWTVLEDCESGDGQVGPPYFVQWDNDSYHDGAAQFLPSTWRSLESTKGYDFAWQAPPSVQRAAEMELQQRSGWGQWPNCTQRMRAAGYIE